MGKVYAMDVSQLHLSPGKDASIVVVVSPLVAIMTDQVMNTEVAT